MSRTIFDPQEFANSITPEQFELALRAYVQKQWARAHKPNMLMLVVSNTTYKTPELADSAQWIMGHSNDGQTKGEILAEVVDEYNRRQGFKSTLMLIEHNAQEIQTPETEA